jgi:type II secretory pathway pseudopilin PulG
MRYREKKSGQTLLEVMVALFVLTVGMLGILSLLSQSIYISKNLSTQTTATYLAAEGIELAKNLTDHDVYQHIAGYGTGWGTAFGSGGSFELDYTTCDNLPQGASCSIPKSFSCETDPLYYDAGSHTYLYPGDDVDGNSPTPTAFSRCINVQPNGSNEITVQSIVYWNLGVVQQNIVLEDDFYNWHPS